MRFEDDFLQAIKDKVPVSAVASETVVLRRSGSELKGLSPFQDERTPSFYVNDRKQFYHCFSSGKHGDVFAFLMETRGMTFPEAVEALASRAGLDMPVQTPGQRARTERRDGLVGVMEEAVRFYQRRLQGPDGSEARAYLREERGIGDGAIAAFRMGYAPRDRQALRRHLSGLGVDVPTMAELGLVGPGRDGHPRDRFANRVVCPIPDHKGRPVGLAGRSLNPLDPAKYLNSPETPLFTKGSLLYNAHAAREAREGPTVAVEGYLDVVAMSQAGYGRVVSPMGTAFTKTQLSLLWELGPEPVIALDGDAAGRAAALRLARSALPHVEAGRTLRFALMPAGLDPDRLVRELGRAAMDDALARSVPLLDLLWHAEASEHPLDTPARLARLESRVGALLATMPEGADRRRHAREAVARIEAIQRNPSPTVRRPPAASARPASSVRARPRDPLATCLSALGRRPDLASRGRPRLLARGPAVAGAVERGLASVDGAGVPDGTAPGDAWMFAEGVDGPRLLKAVMARVADAERAAGGEARLSAAEARYAADPGRAAFDALRRVQAEVAAEAATARPGP